MSTRILIYGGSFNPPHLGHVRSVQVAAAALKPDRIFLIPAATPPHKLMAAGSPEGSHRFAMTELAAEDIPGCEVLDIELSRSGPSYTSDTLRELKEHYPEAELVFLVGTDMLLTLDTWREPEVILSLASIAVFARKSASGDEIREKTRELEARFSARVYILEGEPVEVSSTQIRELLPVRQGRELLPEGVYGYIIRHRLYGAKPDFDWLRERAYAYLKPKRIPHVQGTEAEARRLARRWGVDEEDAAEAAILHDMTKKLNHEEQLRLCEKCGIMTDTCERANEKLLHAKTGAVLAVQDFGAPEHVSRAIRWHTTGRPGMTDLERVIYLADYIEPTRSGFSGLEELRKAAYEDLDGAMELALRMSLVEVLGKGQEPHENTVMAHTYYEKALKDKGAEPVPWDGEATD